MLSETNRRQDLSFDEIVFENRNRMYGAFALRRTYDRNILTGFFISVGFILSILTTMYVIGKAHKLSLFDINKKIARTHTMDMIEVILPEKLDQASAGEKQEEPPKGSSNLKDDEKLLTPTVEKIKEPEKGKEPKDSTEFNAAGTGGKGPVIPSGGGGEQGGGGGGEAGATKAPAIIDIAEVMPVFPGGEEAMFAYLSRNMRYPAYERENGITGTVFVSFVVNVTGAIDQIEILRSPSEGFNDEVIRVVKKMPSWKPGIQGGQKVAVRYKLPVKFSLKS